MLTVQSRGVTLQNVAPRKHGARKLNQTSQSATAVSNKKLSYSSLTMNMTTNRLAIVSASAGLGEEVIAIDPEMAEMGNPNGYRYGLIASVAAVTAEGRRFHHEARWPSEDIAKAEALAARVLAAGSIDLDFWGEGFEVYGSDAWQDADNARQMAHDLSPLRGSVRDV